MAYLKYKGYNGSVEYNDEDNCLYGKVLDMSKDCITFEGESLAELRADFQAAIDDYIAGCEAEGITPRKPYSETINLRMTPDIHGRIAAAAPELDTSINDFINRAIVNELNHAIWHY